MSRRLVFLAALWTAPAAAQFSGLSATPDGSAVYFATTLRLKNAPPLLNGKIFLADSSSVKLFRSHEISDPPAGSPPCAVGGFASYLGAETAAGGVVALTFAADSVPGCSFPTNRAETELIDSASDTVNPGVVRLSPNGRYGLIYLASTARPNSSYTLTLLDRQSGARTPIPPPVLNLFESVVLGPGRVVANDGTAILGVSDFSRVYRGYLLKPGAAPQPFPDGGGMPILIDAAASKVVYQRDGAVYLIDLTTLSSTLLIPAGQPAIGFRMSDDARRLLYLDLSQIRVIDIPTLTTRSLASDAGPISEAALSADGNSIFAVTRSGRLLKIDAATGAETEWIGHTPYLNFFYTTVNAGFTTVLTGNALSSAVYNATVPLKQYLGGVTMWIGERKIPVIQLTPTSITFLPPWDIGPEGAQIRMLAEAPGDHTPFYFPEAEGVIAVAHPRAGAIARQDWSQTYVGPVNTSEVIHVFATGFGPVSPEVPEGAAAPAAEPLARLTQPLTCSNAEVLYAGLAPYAVERAYQIDLRIGATPGYQQFLCTLGGGAPFAFLTLNVTQSTGSALSRDR